MTDGAPSPHARVRRYLYRLLARYIQFFTPTGARVLDVAPKNGFLKYAMRVGAYAAYRPLSRDGLVAEDLLDTIDAARAFEPTRIVLNGTLHVERDIQVLLEGLRSACGPSTRLILVYYSSLWKPLFSLADALGIRTEGLEDNWVAPSDLVNLLALSGFDLVTSQARVLMPFWIPGVSEPLNRWLAPLPGLSWLAMVHVSVARPLSTSFETPPSVSVVVPARNEAGNVEALVNRLPSMGPDDELIFVEGHSSDETWQVIQTTVAAHPTRRITSLQQPGKGKGDAVRAGFAVATREILMILDADLTVSPEDLPKFYRARVSGVCEFVNGSRLVYPMESGAMRFVNMIGNKFFAMAFSFLVGQAFKDTLCGTKVIDRQAYQQLAAERDYFGDFDPFGDFDLLFGAQRLALKIAELPVRYQERTYGTTNISRWRHGWLLLRMTAFAARRVKFI